MYNIKIEKSQLRNQFRSIRKNLEKSYITQSDKSIADLLYSTSQWNRAQKIFIYISVENEPQTQIIIQEAFSKGMLVAAPRCLGNGIMEARLISSLSGLTKSKFGIPEPDDVCPVVSPEEFDLVIAPCVAVDRSFNRLGNGMGYYDRYLPYVSCPIICLCRGKLMADKLPTGPNDFPMDLIITEEGVIHRDYRLL